ncbi:MAG: extracellular solute-binding protein [Synergistaceae bacterium]|nr:extracellular solute-binding protein [Synergistaceae bacterium]
MSGTLKKLALTVMGVFCLAGAVWAAELYEGENALLEAAKKEGGVNSYDTGPTWANWQALFDGFEARYGIEVTFNDLGSGATVVRLDKERNNPQGDTAYYFMPSAAAAQGKEVTEPFKPVHFDKVPDILKDPDGNWFCVHKMTIAFVVNKNLVKETPKSWADLLKPEYSKSVVYLDPRTAGIGYAIVLACAYAQGGDLDNPDAGIEYLAKLQQSGNVRMIEKTTEFDKFVKGEIPIWITYDANAYRAKYIAGLGDAIDIVIPAEGTIASPYAMSLVKGGPNPNTGKLWLNYIMSDEGQGLFAKGYVLPIIPGFQMPAEVADKFLPASDYERVKDVDWVKAAEVQTKLAGLWGSKVLGEN